MPILPFEHLPDSARLWVFAAERALGPDEQRALLDRVDGFLAKWAAHGTPLASGRELRYGRFLFIAVDEARAGVSGCSIDALIRDLKALERAGGVPLVDSAPVWYRDGEAIRGASRERFSKLAQAGAVTSETPVFDNTVETLGALRSGRWETRLGQAWHREVFL